MVDYNYNPFEGPICGLFMTRNYNYSEEDILHTPARTNFKLGQNRQHDLSVKSPDATPLDHATPIHLRCIWHNN